MNATFTNQAPGYWADNGGAQWTLELSGGFDICLSALRSDSSSEWQVMTGETTFGNVATLPASTTEAEVKVHLLTLAKKLLSEALTAVEVAMTPAPVPAATVASEHTYAVRTILATNEQRTILNTFDVVDRSTGNDNSVSLLDLRNRLTLSSKDFDAALTELRRAGILTLSASDRPTSALPYVCPLSGEVFHYCHKRS